MSNEAQADFDDALAAAFAQIESAKKDKKNPHFKSSYADLASVTEAIKGPLTSHGFSWPQTIAMDDGMVVVTTHLRRKGVELTSVLPMPIGDKATPQQVGSAITYARRYALSALVGVAPEDDDGNAASEGGGGKVQRPRAQQRQDPEPARPPSAPRSKEWQDGQRRFGAVCTRRDGFIATNRDAIAKAKIEAVDTKTLACRTLEVEEMPHRFAITPEQWERLIRAFGDDLDDLEMTLGMAKGDEG